MLKKFPLMITLVGSLVIGGHAATASIMNLAQQNVTPSAPVTQQSTTPIETSVAALTLEDLPSGFQPLPPMFAEIIAQQLQLLNQQLGQEQIDPDNLFAFVNPRTMQVVIGYSGELAEASMQAEFDTNLARVQDPNVQADLAGQAREKLAQVQGVELVSYASLEDMDDIADVSGGMRVEVMIQGQTFLVDLVTFRRGDVGALTGLIHPRNTEASVEIKNLATRLDQRIMTSAN